MRGQAVCKAFHRCLSPRELALDELRLGARGGDSWLTRYYFPLADWVCRVQPGVRCLRISAGLGPAAPAARRVRQALLALQRTVSGSPLELHSSLCLQLCRLRGRADCWLPFCSIRTNR